MKKRKTSKLELTGQSLKLTSQKLEIVGSSDENEFVSFSLATVGLGDNVSLEAICSRAKSLGLKPVVRLEVFDISDLRSLLKVVDTGILFIPWKSKTGIRVIEVRIYKGGMYLLTGDPNGRWNSNSFWVFRT